MERSIDMKERPIIMGAESVRAILEGRKTQTRRVIKPQPRWGSDVVGVKIIDGVVFPINSFPSQCGCPIYLSGIKEYIYGTKQPYGVIGDRLCVKETWGVVSHTFDENENICDWKPNRPAKQIRELKFGTGYYDGHVIYKADGGFEWNAGDDCSIETKIAWKSPLFMPRCASRILLEITDIRVERVQDVSEEDAIAEGVEFGSCWEEQFGEGYCTGEGWMDYRNADYGCSTPKESYKTLWDSLNAKRGYSWEKNPWVWVIEFKVVEP
jgi:hypothetical protein